MIPMAQEVLAVGLSVVGTLFQEIQKNFLETLIGQTTYADGGRTKPFRDQSEPMTGRPMRYVWRQS